MKRLITIITFAIILVGLVLFGLTDLKISVADTSVPNDEVVSSVSKARNSSASVTIMIAWTTPSGEGGSNEL